MPSSKPLFDRPCRLQDEVAVTIIGLIRRRQLMAGDRLPTEAVFSKCFGVARTVVREAMLKRRDQPHTLDSVMLPID